MDSVVLPFIAALPILLLYLAPHAIKKLEELPHRDFVEASVPAKIGRLIFCGLFLVTVLGPFLWFVFSR
jgi:hypothetical protein